MQKIILEKSEVEKGRSFRIYEATIKSKATKVSYSYSLFEFIKFANMKSYDDMTNLETDKIQELLENWVMSLTQRGLKGKTILTKLLAVELLLEMNKKIYYKKILHKLIPIDDVEPGGEVPFTNQEIQRMLCCTTKLRTKALIYFLACTGIRPGAIADPVIRLKHLFDMPYGCKAIRIYDGSKSCYWAFLTPEATKALDDYIKSRKFNGEEITPESILFVNSNKSKTTYEHLSYDSVREILVNLFKAAGIERTKKGNRYDKALSYGFRKRFNGILKMNNEVNSNIAEKLMAHKKGLDGSYLKPTREECFAEFVKAIHDLTISDEERVKTENAKIKEKMEEREAKDEEIEKLKERFEEDHKKVMQFDEITESFQYCINLFRGKTTKPDDEKFKEKCEEYEKSYIKKAILDPSLKLITYQSKIV